MGSILLGFGDAPKMDDNALNFWELKLSLERTECGPAPV